MFKSSRHSIYLADHLQSVLCTDLEHRWAIFGYAVFRLRVKFTIINAGSNKQSVLWIISISISMLGSVKVSNHCLKMATNQQMEIVGSSKIVYEKDIQLYNYSICCVLTYWSNITWLISQFRGHFSSRLADPNTTTFYIIK